MQETLVFIPTYNEKENVSPLFARLRALPLRFDILFIDDGSPDGTGALLDGIAKQHAGVFVRHRTGKLGIGSAHKEAIRWAREKGYQNLITMDSDFTHPPEKVPDLAAAHPSSAVVVGSRFLSEGGIQKWSAMRRVVTKVAHGLTRSLLGLRYDATNAFRLYRLGKLPIGFEDKIHSDGYSFFFESLHFLDHNRFPISEIPLVLDARAHGDSKMTLFEVYRSIRMLLELRFRKL